eukprot:gene12679-17000_t
MSLVHLLTVTFFALYMCSSEQMGKDELLVNVEADRCTTIVVGSKAGTQGAMNTHTADCSDCDFRINKVPAATWQIGSTRKLYLYKGNYPATIASDRGQTWHPSNLEGTKEQLQAWGKESIITGEIPQVSHTYALYEAGYGIMNEHQVAIGESTCAAKFWGAPVTAGGKAHIEVREMSRIALERSTTARGAIQLMGDLAVKYGFYAADWSGGDASKGEGGEALTVIDKSEAWVFHVLGDDTGASAIWVAQKLQSDHVAAVANQFIIKEVDPDSDHFMYSDNLWEVAIRNGLWSEKDGKLLNFVKTYGPVRAHSPYATRRVWRVFNLVAPSLNLPPNTDSYGSDYPFSVKAETLLSPQDLMRIQRDHYEGSQFDLTKGLQAGPYGDPNRWDMTPVGNLTYTDMIQGSYERAISLFRTSYSFVAVSRPKVPDILALLWFSQYAPSSSSYAPFYVASTIVPAPYSRGSLFKYDSFSSFWNFCAAGNYAGRFYKYAMQDVFELQEKLMNHSIDAVNQIEKDLMASLLNDKTASISTISAATALLTLLTDGEGIYIVQSWRDLLPQLITKYHDGYIAQDLTQPNIHMKKLFYPKWWLDLTHFWDNKPNTGDGVILFEPNPVSL